MSQDWNEYADRLQRQLPAAPEPLLEGYVNWVPWVYMIFGGLGLILGVCLLVLGAVLAPMMVLFGYSGSGVQLIISIVALLIGSGLGLLGGYWMKKRLLMGWWLISIALVVDALQALFTGHIFNLVVLVAFGYIHLSVKPRYTLA